MQLQPHLITVALLLTGSAVALAQEPSIDKAQPEHKLLERLAGEWEFEKRSIPEKGDKPETVGKGKVSAELVGEFFVVCRWSGELYGADYEAFQSLGYDIEQKKYTGCWLDSTMSYRWELSGTVDKNSQEFIVTSSGPGPSGGAAKFRERYHFDSEDSITVIGEMQQGEEWVAFVKTHLSRNR
jgi:hypothetical protein